MTQEQKAQAYDEALEKARKRVTIEPQDHTDAILKDIFPQLKESEDERMLREIKRYIKEQGDKPNGLPNGTVAISDMIAWLEKQKEHKPSTPKYRVGDVMRTKQEAAEGITDGLPVIVSMDDDYYYCTNEKIPISEQEEYEFPPMNMKQKPAEWNEEDEKMQKSIDLSLDCYSEGQLPALVMQISREREWIKSLPGRFNFQPKAEWSEEDEKTIDDAYCWLCEYAGSLIQRNYGKSSMLYGIANKLKSIRPSWKPTEHQMNILKAVKDYVGKGSGYWGEGLGSLIDDLEKLM